MTKNKTQELTQKNNTQSEVSPKESKGKIVKEKVIKKTKTEKVASSEVKQVSLPKSEQKVEDTSEVKVSTPVKLKAVKIKSSVDKAVSKKGKRKSSIAVARLASPSEDSVVIVNKKDYRKYFSKLSDQTKIVEPIVATQLLTPSLAFSVKVIGGGTTGQAEATRLAIAKVISENSEEARVTLRKLGLLTSDDRQVQQKTTGKRKARKSEQWSKR